MIFLENRQDAGLQTEFSFLRGTRATNVPPPPDDFDRFPGKYALDCDAPGLGAWVIAPLYDPAISGELATARQGASAEIDAAAEAARLRYITPGAGQAMTYLEKRANAQAYKDAAYPSAQLAQYPWVQAEKVATGVTGAVAADLILTKAAEWEAIGANIDRERRAGIVAVEAAADVAAVEAARDSAVAALEVI